MTGGVAEQHANLKMLMAAYFSVPQHSVHAAASCLEKAGV